MIYFVPLKKLDEATHFLCSCSLGNPLGRDICFVAFCWCLLCVGYSNSVCLQDTFQLIMKVLPSSGGSAHTRREEGQEGRWTWRRLQLLSFPFCPTVDKPLDHGLVETAAPWGWSLCSLRATCSVGTWGGFFSYECSSHTQSPCSQPTGSRTLAQLPALTSPPTTSGLLEPHTNITQQTQISIRRSMKPWRKLQKFPQLMFSLSRKAFSGSSRWQNNITSSVFLEAFLLL